MYKVSVRQAQVTLYVKGFDYCTESLEPSTDMHAAGGFDSDEMMDLGKYIERVLGVEIDWASELDD